MLRIAAAPTFCSLFVPVSFASAQHRSTEATDDAPTSPAPRTVDDDAPTGYDQIWAFTDLYEDNANRTVQKVVFTGRYQHDFARLDANQGRLDEWNVRRMRLGSKVTLFRTFTLHSEVEVAPEEAAPLYERFTDLYLQWHPTAGPRVLGEPPIRSRDVGARTDLSAASGYLDQGDL